jgi:hypothetical protein
MWQQKSARLQNRREVQVWAQASWWLLCQEPSWWQLVSLVKSTECGYEANLDLRAINHLMKRCISFYLTCIVCFEGRVIKLSVYKILLASFKLYVASMSHENGSCDKMVMHNRAKSAHYPTMLTSVVQLALLQDQLHAPSTRIITKHSHFWHGTYCRTCGGSTAHSSYASFAYLKFLLGAYYVAVSSSILVCWPVCGLK